MSRITSVIGSQSFEKVRDRIALILADELQNQLLIGYDGNLDVDVYTERFVPFGHAELPAVNVMLMRGEYDGQTAVQHDGTYRYIIECCTLGTTDGLKRGDEKAMKALHKLLGVCRSILMDSKYIRLGYTVPFIMNRHVEAISIMDTGKTDATKSVAGRLILVVKVGEESDLAQGRVADGYDTSWTIDDTDEGYLLVHEP